MWHDLIKLWKSNNLLDEAWNRSFEMLEICQEMFYEGVRVLRDTDGGDINKEIRKKDKTVNKYERKVRREILTHLAVQGTMDIPASLVLVTIVIDIERIGDYNKNIMDLVKYYPDPLQGGRYEGDLKRIENAIKDSFGRVINCVKESDVESALQLISDYGWINEVCDECIASLVMGEDKSLSNGRSAALAMYFRYLKRINAHFRNITSSVVNPFDRIGYKVKNKDLID
jgi:phosphate uptake regulator